MKLASIVPINDISHTFDGDYAMLLAHLAKYYPTKHPKNCYVIMDNSLIELGSAVTIADVYNAAIQCNADELILPDVFLDGQKTIESVVKSLQWLREHATREIHCMAVCQGSDANEFIKCFKQLEAMPEVYCIGIPKVAEKLMPATIGRPGFESLWRGCSKAIHLLGCWTSLNEFRQYKQPALIRSCDTCIPALLSTHNLTDAWENRPNKTIDLINDRINPEAYETIIKQLKQERLV